MNYDTIDNRMYVLYVNTEDYIIKGTCKSDETNVDYDVFREFVVFQSLNTEYYVLLSLLSR